MALPPGLHTALYGSSLFLIGAVLLFFTILRRSFELRRAMIFLEFRFYERFFVTMGAVILGLVGADVARTLLDPASMPLFPDGVTRAILYTCVVLLYAKFYLTIGRGPRASTISPAPREERPPREG
ncbi:MAG: hypothetical protein QXO51_00805 [Halobacteria archaeon]